MTGHDKDFPAPLLEMRVRRLVLQPRPVSGAAEAALAGASTSPDAGSEAEDDPPTRGHDLHQEPKPRPG